MERPSQKRIAKLLGISTAAVSLALRDKGTVSRELSEKVKATAHQIGYRPNPMLASLASRRFKSSGATQGVPIAMINFLRKGAGPGLYAHHLQQRAEELGYNLSVIKDYELAHYSNPSKTLYNRGVQGLIIVGPVADSAFRSDFEWDEFSVVQCGRFLEPLNFDTVRPNIFQSIKQAYQRCKKAGYRRIGFALGHHDTILEDDESRLSAVLGIQQIEVPECERIPPFFDTLQDATKLIGWARQHRPDCVIGFHIGLCGALLKAGLKIPEEIGFASLHLTGPQTLGDSRNLSIAGNDQNLEEIARQSMNVIDQSIRHHIRGTPSYPRHVLVPASWIDGDSLPMRRPPSTQQANEDLAPLAQAAQGTPVTA